MKKYPSKISFGLLFFILLILAGSAILMVSPPVWIGLIVNVLLFMSTYYLIDGRFLIIRSSFLINKKIKISSVKKISETNNPLSAPAASLDRLEIIYDNNGSVLISPKDKSGFIKHITRLNPQIEAAYKARDKK